MFAGWFLLLVISLYPWIFLSVYSPWKLIWGNLYLLLPVPKHRQSTANLNLQLDVFAFDHTSEVIWSYISTPGLACHHNFSQVVSSPSSWFTPVWSRQGVSLRKHRADAGLEFLFCEACQSSSSLANAFSVKAVCVQVPLWVHTFS